MYKTSPCECLGIYSMFTAQIIYQGWQTFVRSVSWAKVRFPGQDMHLGFQVPIIFLHHRKST